MKKKGKTNCNDNNHTYRVKRGVAAQHPQKYNLDEAELERVSALARVELEDARAELERASAAAAAEMGKGAEGAEADDHEEDDEDAWVECVCDSMLSYIHHYHFSWFSSFCFCLLVRLCLCG